MTPLRQRMLEDMQMRNLSPHTQECYVRAVAHFAKHYGKSPDQLGPGEVRAYLLHMIHERHVSWSLYNQARCALRFFYRITLKQSFALEEISCAKTGKKLPVVLSRDEVAQFFSAARRPKARAVLMTIYAAGLRVSEAVHLRVSDIDSRRMVIRVHQGKGKKDRYVMLSPKLLAELRSVLEDCPADRMAVPWPKSPATDEPAERAEFVRTGRASGRVEQGREPAHVTPFLRDPSA